MTLRGTSLRLSGLNCGMQTKRIILPAILFSLLCSVSCTKESPETSGFSEPKDQNTASLLWDSTYRPLLHKFTSTGCGGCGRFGIPLFDSVAHQMGDSILPLLTHFKYNDPFINPSSQAIEKAWVTHYSSPQIWINHEEKTLELIRTGLPGAIEQCRDFLRNEMKASADAHLAIAFKRNASGRFDLHVGIKNNSPETKQWHVQVYGMEDSVWASQSGVWPPPHHFFVNRG